MKKLAMTLFFFASIAVACLAQDTPASTQAAATVQLAKAEKIELNAVPKNVLVALNKTSYKQADVTEVLELQVEEGKAYKFIVNHAQGKRAVTFDANGTMLHDKKQDE